MFGNLSPMVRYILKGNRSWTIEGEADTDDSSYTVMCTSTPIKDKLFKIIYDKFLKHMVKGTDYHEGAVGTIINLTDNVPEKYQEQILNLVGKFSLKGITVLSKELKSAYIERKANGWILYIEITGVFK